MPDARQPSAPLARLGVCVGGGLLVASAMPPWGFWPLAFVGIACFDLAIGDEPARSRRATAGFAFGLPWMLAGMAWMWFLTVPGFLVTSLVFAALHAAAAAVAPAGPWRAIGRPATHTLAEIVRMLVPFGGVPLATLGISQAGGPLLVVARVGGVILLTWLVFQIAIGAAELVRRGVVAARDRSPSLVSPSRLGSAGLAAAAVVVAVAVAAPSGRDRDVDPVTIAAVQGGGEQGTSALNVPSSRVTRAHLDATATIEPDDDLDLVVWPENGVDVDGIAFAESQALVEVAAEAARLDVPFTIGVTVDSEFSAHPSEGRFVNAQLVITPEGEVTGSYEKVRIVPFGEYVPLRGVLEALGAPLDQIPSDAVRGRDPAVIELPDGTRLGVMISWEVFFGDRGRAGSDSDILINPTNGASYTGTIVQTQQVASSRLRAMETGRWVVQVSPTGFSAFVSPAGDVFQRTDVGERRVITMDVPPRTGSTWYTSLGDVPWIIAALAVTGLSLWFGGGRDRIRSRAAA
jgi:apolipoprotein N-acyltransferase